MGVEWWLTKLEYKNTRGIANYGDWDYDEGIVYPNNQGYQKWTLGADAKYTNIYINIIDDFNDQLLFQFVGTPEDSVHGYTLSQIESTMLKNIYGLYSVGQQLKANKPAGVTDVDIDKLISYY